MAERLYRCRTCGKEWPDHSPASKHKKNLPDHDIEVLDVSAGEVKPFIPGKGAYRRANKIPIVETPPEAASPVVGAKPPEATPSVEVAKPGAEVAGIATDKVPPKFLMIGTLRMPLEDWGYSSLYNLLVVAQTYEEVKKEFNYEGKVGDFCAEVVRIFRMLGGYDQIGGEHERLSVEIVEGEGGAKPQ